VDVVSVVRGAAERYGGEIGLSYVIFFGSAVRGTLRPLSDVDIAVKFKAKPSLRALGAMLADLEDVLKRRIDVVILPVENYSLMFEIYGHGVLVWGDYAEYVKDKAKAFDLYHDFVEHRRKHAVSR